MQFHTGPLKCSSRTEWLRLKSDSLRLPTQVASRDTEAKTLTAVFLFAFGEETNKYEDLYMVRQNMGKMTNEVTTGPGLFKLGASYHEAELAS